MAYYKHLNNIKNAGLIWAYSSSIFGIGLLWYGLNVEVYYFVLYILKETLRDKDSEKTD